MAVADDNYKHCMPNETHIADHLQVRPQEHCKQSFDRPLRREEITLLYPTYGNGSGWVYCYYLPYVRRLKIKMGEARWPCKIGCSEQEDVRDRVRNQFRSVAVFDVPVIGFLVKSDEPGKLEDKIHERLEKYKIDPVNGEGTEWFETNIGEVRKIYREVSWPKWFRMPIRLWLAVYMMLPIRRDNLGNEQAAK